MTWWGDNIYAPRGTGWGEVEASQREMSRQFQEQQAAWQRKYGSRSARRGKTRRVSKTRGEATLFDAWKGHAFLWTLTVLFSNGFSPFWPSVVAGVVVGTLILIPHRFLPRLTTLFTMGVCFLAIWGAIAGG